MSQTTQNSVERHSYRRGLPVSALGLTFYPITMAHYEAFLYCKDAVTLRLASLPVQFISMDYMTALFAIDQEEKFNAKFGGNMFAKAIKLLYLSLRIEGENRNLIEDLQFEPQNGKLNLKGIKVTQEGATVVITTREFSDVVRPIIAGLNGLQLPDESHNIELVKANEQRNAILQMQGQTALKANTDDLIASVAYLSHVSEREINGWSIREFENRKRAIDRDKKYMLYGQAEMSGMVSFKKGNPAPSWCFDKIDDMLGTMSLDDLGKQTQGIQQKQ